MRQSVLVARYALPVVVVLASATAAFAQSLVCEPIRRGESAAHAARRMTGDGRNTYRTSFQIMNGASRFIPKSQYNRVRAGWRACVIKPVVRKAAVDAERRRGLETTVATGGSAPDGPDHRAAAPVQVPIAGLSSPIEPTGVQPTLVSQVLLLARQRELLIVWVAVGLVVPWFGWRILDHQLTQRKTTMLVMRHFAHRFVDEFERPLRHDVRERAVRTQLRLRPQRGRFDILLSPGIGRRYPNLSDHKKNVEYDLARVMQVLADRSFAYGKPYMRGSWVVVPFQFTAERKPTGVSCISSL